MCCREVYNDPRNAEELSEIGCWTKEGTLLLERDVERWLVLKPLLDGRVQLVLGLNINEFSFLFTSCVCTFLFSRCLYLSSSFSFSVNM